MLYRLLIDVTKEDGRSFPSVRHVITTGDKMPASSLEALPGLFPNARFFNIYGCTETNDSLVHEFEHLAEGDVPMNIPLGKAIPGVVMMIKTEDGAALDGTGAALATGNKSGGDTVIGVQQQGQSGFSLGASAGAQSQTAALALGGAPQKGGGSTVPTPGGSFSTGGAQGGAGGAQGGAGGAQGGAGGAQGGAGGAQGGAGGAQGGGGGP